MSLPTPERPWVYDRFSGRIIRTTFEEPICEYVTEKDGQFIVRACNSHEVMVEALKLALDYYFSIGTKKYNPYEVEQALEKAIVQAEGRTA